MNKNLLVGLGIFLAVIVTGIFLVKKPTPSSPTKGMPVPGSNVNEKVVTNNSLPAREIAVSGNEYSFTPSSIKARAGEKIRIIFTNTGRLPHDFVIDELNVKTNKLGPGDSESFDFTAESDVEIEFYCSIGNHKAQGMKGTLEIQ